MSNVIQYNISNVTIDSYNLAAEWFIELCVENGFNVFSIVLTKIIDRVNSLINVNDCATRSSDVCDLSVRNFVQ